MKQVNDETILHSQLHISSAQPSLHPGTHCFLCHDECQEFQLLSELKCYTRNVLYKSHSDSECENHSQLLQETEQYKSTPNMLHKGRNCSIFIIIIQKFPVPITKRTQVYATSQKSVRAENRVGEQLHLLHYKNADHPQQASDNTTGIHFNTNGWKHITLCIRRIQCYKVREGTWAGKLSTKKSHKVKFMSNGLQQIGSCHVHYKSHETSARFMLRLVLFILYMRIWLTLLQHATRYYLAYSDNKQMYIDCLQQEPSHRAADDLQLTQIQCRQHRTDLDGHQVQRVEDPCLLSFCDTRWCPCHRNTCRLHSWSHVDNSCVIRQARHRSQC